MLPGTEVHNEYDQVAKLTLGEVLEPYGDIRLEHEIRPGPSQRADVSFTPGALPPPMEWPAYLRLLLRMAGWPCHLEPFSSTPGYFTVRQCVRKQFDVHSQLAQMDPPRLPPDRPPMVWIFSPGRPETALRRLGATPAADWPAGFYLAAEGWALGLVVLRELPRTRDTLVLRLLGPRTMREAALAEIGEIPEEDPDHRPLLRLVRALQRLLGHGTQISDEERRALMTEAMAWVLAEEERVRKEGLKEGLKEGRKEALLMAVKGTCELLGIPLTAPREAVLARLDDEGLGALYDRLRTGRRWPDGG